MRRTALAAGFLLILASGAARADVTDFEGIWADPAADGSGISRIVVTPGTGSRLNIRVFGRCVPKECDWGGGPARLYADGPQGREITLAAFDIDAGFARKRLTLRQAVGHTLRFEMQTDFADGRQGYVTTGAVNYIGTWDEAPRVAETPPPAAPPPPSTTGAAPPVAAIAAAPPPPPPEAAPVPSDSAPSAEAPSAGWLGDVGLGPAQPHGYRAAAGEDCTPFDPGQTRAANTDGNWRVGDFSHHLVNFGSSRAHAQRALAVIGFYHFDEICYVTRESPTMLYWKRAGAVPKESAPGEVCIAIDPAAIKAETHDGAWSVMSGLTALLEYGGDQKAAEQAASVIKTYRLNRQCFAGPPGTGMQYWLAQ